MTLNVLSPTSSFSDVWSNDGTFLSLIEDTAATRQAMDECCCNPLCDCNSICDSPFWRIQFQQPGMSDCIGTFGTCFESASYTGQMTEVLPGGPGFSPDPQPPTGPVTRYWKTLASISPCGTPNPVLVEFCCVQSDKKRYIRINGGSWCDVGATDCDHYWNRVFISGSEIITNTGNPACCGIPTLEIWCGDTPDPPNCDLVQTGSGVCG